MRCFLRSICFKFSVQYCVCPNCYTKHVCPNCYTKLVNIHYLYCNTHFVQTYCIILMANYYAVAAVDDDNDNYDVAEFLVICRFQCVRISAWLFSFKSQGLHKNNNCFVILMFFVCIFGVRSMTLLFITTPYSDLSVFDMIKFPFMSSLLPHTYMYILCSILIFWQVLVNNDKVQG